MAKKAELLKKIEDRSAVCAVIGLGYVGLPLAVELANAGFSVRGVDVDSEKAGMIGKGESYIPDVSGENLRKAVKSGRLTAGGDYSILVECDTVNICVPTPLRKTRDPDISFIVAALEEIKKYVHPGMLIVLESTSYPGTTEEIVVSELTGSKLQVGKDFFVAFSPERVDPGNPVYHTGNIPKVVGGVTTECTEVAAALYGHVVEEIHAVSSTRVAEMIKLLENTFRSVNIGLVNEIALMCNQMGINVWEVIEGAATKPFGFMPFFPGPGLGGHCIPIDPFYLSWKARSVGFEARFIELAGQVNSYMPLHVVGKAMDALNAAGKSVSGSKVMILGVAYKKNIDDTRESPALDIISKLNVKGAEIVFADPYVDELAVEGIDSSIEKVELNKATLSEADLVVIIADHDAFDYELVLKHAPLILDTRNALKGAGGDRVWSI